MLRLPANQLQDSTDPDALKAKGPAGLGTLIRAKFDRHVEQINGLEDEAMRILIQRAEWPRDLIQKATMNLRVVEAELQVAGEKHSADGMAPQI